MKTDYYFAFRPGQTHLEAPAGWPTPAQARAEGGPLANVAQVNMGELLREDAQAFVLIEHLMPRLPKLRTRGH